MPVLRNIGTLVTCAAPGGQGQIHEIRRAAMVWERSHILWVGPEADLPAEYKNQEEHNAMGMLVMPGLIDCHTHLAFGGWRHDEFEARILGKSYLDIARAGGGIRRTMRDTRAATEYDLLMKSRDFVSEMSQLGVTTIECKTGYGLSYEEELKLLRVYQQLQVEQPVAIIPTLLGAHIVPPEFEDRRQDYLWLLQEELIPCAAQTGIAKYCDVFVEETAFTIEEARSILQAASWYGLKGMIHADQLSDTGGASLAAEVGALSASHLEYASDEGIRAMAAAGVVAVSLPIASLYLGQPAIDARKFIEAGVPVAVATDFNPGSAPSYHLPLAMMLACTMQRMTPAEALKGATLYAAQALDLHDQIGSLEPGKQSDFILVDAESVNHWLSHFRPNAVVATFIKGSSYKVGY